MDLEQVNKQQADFTRLLLKTPLEKYTQQLWEAFQAIACDAYEVSNVFNDIAHKARTRIDYTTRLAKNLLAILNNEPLKAGKANVTSKKALEALKQALIEEYKDMGMNQRQMTFEEAEAELKGWRNNINAENWIRGQLAFLAEEINLSADEDLDTFCTDPSNVEYYAEVITICEEITPEQIETAIELNTYKKKGGKKPKNLKLAWLILEIRQYYKGQRNQDYRLIFDCMDLFGLIDKEVKRAWNKKSDKELKKAKTQYIKSIYKQAMRFESDTQPILVARLKGIGLDFHDTL